MQGNRTHLRTSAVAAVACGFALVGCKSKEAGDIPGAERPAYEQSRHAIDPCDPVTIDQSMVVHDQDTIGLVDFSFQRTIAAIRNTSGGAATTDAALAESITSGLLTDPMIQPVSGLPIPTTTRPPEAALTGAQLLSQMRPIALFNRFDLVPDDASHCGEYRIVYGRYPNTTTNRLLIIFEAALPNPNPGMGIEGCRDVAEFWHGLSEPTMTDAQRATALADFYYSGLPGFSPVVRHGHYGVPFGQVRTNMFVNAAAQNFTWQLREWRSGFDLGGVPVFVPDTVKDNPLVEFHDQTSANPNPALFSTEQAAYVSHYTNGVMPNLLAFEINGGTPVVACPEVNAFGAGVDDRFNEFASESNGPNADDPVAAASTSFESSIDTVLNGNILFSSLNPDHVLSRSGAMSCAGCHQLSVGDAISPTATWPGVAPGGFVHVRELGAAPPNPAPLSPALTSCFLPARAQHLESFLCSAPPPDGGVADSGSAPDSGSRDSGVAVPCGGPYGNSCGPTEYCEFGPYNICGANGPGTCEPRPVSCPYGGSTVCGCDGSSYPNECEANAAGTDVQAQGSCGCSLKPPTGCCFEDSQCGGRGGQCVSATCSKDGAGVCKGTPPKDTCWDAGDCGAGEACVGASVCPCGASCLVPDSPGECKKIEKSSRAAVTAAQTKLLSSTDQASAERALKEFEDVVRAEREAEREKPGAFWPVRRTH